MKDDFDANQPAPPKSNDNINITEALGLKKRKDGRQAFMDVIADLERRGLDWTSISECMAQAVVGDTLSKIDYIDYREALEQESKVQSLRFKLHDVFMRIRKRTEYYTG